MFSRQIFSSTFGSLRRTTKDYSVSAIGKVSSLRKGAVYYRPSAAICRMLCDAKDPKDKLSSQEPEKISYIPKYQVQPIDRFFLIVTGTMKPGEIPTEISYELIEKSQNRRRIMLNIFTMFLTVCGSIWAISRGRRARDEKTEDSIFQRNLKRYEKLREEDRLKEEKAKNS